MNEEQTLFEERKIELLKKILGMLETINERMTVSNDRQIEEGIKHIIELDELDKIDEGMADE